MNLEQMNLYVEEKLLQLDKRNRRIAEKRISDVLFEIEMSADMQQMESSTTSNEILTVALILVYSNKGNKVPTTFRDNLTWICLTNDFLCFL